MCYNIENAKILLQLTALAQKTREYLAALSLANEMIDTVDGGYKICFWGIVEESLSIQLLSVLTKLFDKAETCGKKNCSLGLLHKILMQENDRDNGKYEKEIGEIDSLYQHYEQIISQKLRNTKIAHFDLDSISNGAPTTICFSDICNLVEESCKLITSISSKVFIEIDFPPIDLLVEAMKQREVTP